VHSSRGAATYLHHHRLAPVVKAAVGVEEFGGWGGVSPSLMTVEEDGRGRWWTSGGAAGGAREAGLQRDDELDNDSREEAIRP
jgi:hypothetical protein